MATYPGSAPSFTTKVDGNAIAASHMNDAQNEIVAIGAALLAGLAHTVKPSADATFDLGDALKRWRDLFISRDVAIGRNATVAGTLGVTGALTAASATVAGTVTAGSYSGDGSGLTGVVAVTVVDVPVGTILMTGKAAAPALYLLCDGSAVDRTTYSALFTAIGTTFGAGDGSTTFNLPDMRGKFPLGKSAAGTGSVLGSTGGSLDHTHSVVDHTHAVGTLAVASHSHDFGTLAVSSHTHSSGTFIVASHTHSAGTYAVGSHSHTSGTISAGSHTHTTGTTSCVGGGGPTVVTSLNSTSLSFSGSVAAATPSFSGSSGSAAPDVSGNTGSTAPTVSGNTGSQSPAVTGSTAAGGAQTSSATNPAYVSVNYIIRT